MARQSSYLTSYTATHCLRLPPATESSWSWQLQAKCRGQSPEMFFPEEHTGTGRRREELAAKRICGQCPVLNECRDHALRTPELHGIWGAMTPRERSQVRTIRLRAGNG